MDEEKEEARRKQRRLDTLLVVAAVAALALNVGYAVLRPQSPPAEGAPGETPFPVVDQRLMYQAVQRFNQAATPQEQWELFWEHPQYGPALRQAAVGFLGLVLIGAGVLVAVVLGVLALSGVRLLPQTNLVPGRWGLPDVLVVFGVFLTLYAGLIVWSLVDPVAEAVLQGPMALYLSAGVSAVLVVIAAALVRALHGEWLRPLGLTTKDAGKNLLRGVLGYLAVWPFAAVALLVLRLVAPAAPFNPVIGIVRRMHSPVQLAVMFALIAVVVPVLEEALFRGFLYPAVRRYGSVWPSIIVTSVLFGLVHPGVDKLPIVVLAIGFNVLRERTGSLVPCIVGHVALNTQTVLLLLLMK